MLLTQARIRVFKSIEDSGLVPIDSWVTVLVGQNEAGKTAFLQALHKALPVEKGPQYDVVEDYPRRDLNAYQRKHETNPSVVAELTYQLQDKEIAEINEDLGFNLLTELQLTVGYDYANKVTIGMSIAQEPYLAHLSKTAILTQNVAQAIVAASSIRGAITLLQSLDLNGEETAF